jgi:hypothetical protein
VFGSHHAKRAVGMIFHSGDSLTHFLHEFDRLLDVVSVMREWFAWHVEKLKHRDFPSAEQYDRRKKIAMAIFIFYLMRSRFAEVTLAVLMLILR